MNAEIIAVGSELLLGQIINTNAQFLSKNLANMGINVFFHTVVGDNAARLKSAIEIAESRADIIFFTGGLGPTKDDLTKETIANHLKKSLLIDQTSLKSIEEYFQKSGRIMTPNNKKQALVLKDSEVLPNDYGMAPGMIVTEKNIMYILLPGPPKEMEPMFLTYAQRKMMSKLPLQEQIVSRVLRFFGIGESQLETDIADLIDNQTNPTIAPLAGDGEVTLRLTAKHGSFNAAEDLINQTEKLIVERVGHYFYGYDDTSLMKELSGVLKEKQLTISVAESLTGGMFQKDLTSIPGSGAILKGGIVCYSPEIKEKVLHVKKETILNDGVVSAPCAKELAENVAALMDSDIGISFTGVAGPGELEGKPVGSVFIGIKIKGKPTRIEKLSLAGNRNSIRIRSVKYGCYFLLNSIKTIYGD